MRISFLFLTFLLPATALANAACPNFSGEYLWESADGENRTSLEIRQQGCTKSVMIFDPGFGFDIKHEHIFDGKRYLVEDNGDFQAYETAEITPTEIKIHEERVRTDEDDGSTSTYFVNILFTKDASGNLVEKRETVRQDGVVTDTDKLVYTAR